MNDMKSQKVIIEKSPELKTYVDDAYLLSVVTKENPNYIKWIANYYTQLIYTYDDFDNMDGHCISFYGGKYDQCTFIDLKLVPKESIGSESEFYEFINQKLDDGYCIIIELNEFHVPDRRSYQKQYRRHTSMIYSMIIKPGIELDIIGYKTNGDYAPTKINGNELYKAFKTMTDEGWPIKLIRRNDNEFIPDSGKIEYDLKAYYDGGLEEDVYGKGELFGLDVWKKLIEILIDIKNDKYRKDIRLLSIFAEHKQIMLRKLKYFEEANILDESSELNHWIAQYELIIEEAKICFKLFVKYSITSDETVIDNIIFKIQKIIRQEKEVFLKLHIKFKNRLFDLR